MLKKTIAGVLVCMMIAIPVLTGCSSVSNQNNEAVEATNENSVTSEIVSEAASEAESGTAGKTGGGKPWIDSDLKENISEDTVTDPKDDFHLYANKEWLLKNNIPDGYSAWSHFHERGLEVKKQCMELLKDDSLTGHDAELIQTYCNLILDWDARNERGVSDLLDLYDK